MSKVYTMAWKIKPLEWNDAGRLGPRAEIPFGYYLIIRREAHIPAARYEVSCNVDNEMPEWDQCFPTIEQCKEAAQAHWEEALTPFLQEIVV